MPLNIDYKELENRMQQGLAASAGTFAMVSVASFRMGHEKGLLLKPSKVFKFSLLVSAISGIVWSMMPRAKEPPSTTIDKAKEQIYPALKVAFSRLVSNEETLRSTVSSTQERKPSYSYSSPRTSSISSLGSADKNRSMDRLNRRYGSSFSSGFEDDDDDDLDFMDEEDFEDMLRQELESDPFYEGPGSVFDRV